MINLRSVKSDAQCGNDTNIPLLGCEMKTIRVISAFITKRQFRVCFNATLLWLIIISTFSAVAKDITAIDEFKNKLRSLGWVIFDESNREVYEALPKESRTCTYMTRITDIVQPQKMPRLRSLMNELTSDYLYDGNVQNGEIRSFCIGNDQRLSVNFKGNGKQLKNGIFLAKKPISHSTANELSELSPDCSINTKRKHAGSAKLQCVSP